MALVAILMLLLLLALTFDSVRVLALRTSAIAGRLLLSNAARLVTRKVDESDKKSINISDTDDAKFQARVLQIVTEHHSHFPLQPEALALARKAFFNEMNGETAIRETVKATEELRSEMSTLKQEVTQKVILFDAHLQHVKAVEALQQDMKVASNRLRAEVAAAKHETMELSELRKDVEKSLRRLRLDIETAAAAKNQVSWQLRAEVDVCNKALARLENEVQRLSCFKAELEATMLRNARAASAEKHHNSRNSTAPSKNKQTLTRRQRPSCKTKRA